MDNTPDEPLPNTDQLCTNSSKPHLLAFHVGAHYGFSSATVITKVIKPYMEHINATLKNCQYGIRSKIHFLLFGLPAVNTILQQKYPQQNHTLIKQYHKEIEAYLMTAPIQTIFLDFFEVTREAIEDGRTSDGFHLLTDINIVKVLTVVHVMNLLTHRLRCRKP